jgi:hypothetical protein
MWDFLSRALVTQKSVHLSQTLSQAAFGIRSHLFALQKNILRVTLLQTLAERTVFSAPDAIVKAKKKEIKRDHTAKLLSLVNKDALTEYLNSDEFKAEWKKKAREILTEQVRRTSKVEVPFNHDLLTSKHWLPMGQPRPNLKGPSDLCAVDTLFF